MNICILILYTNSWQNIADVVLDNAVEYTYKHGYNLSIRRYPECFSGYDKLEWSKSLLLENDYVWNLDLDALITNHNIRIEQFLDSDKNFFITYGANTYNAGSFILKKSAWANWFIEYLLSKKGEEKMHCEQDAILKYIEEYGTEDICILPHPSINSFMYDLYPEYSNVKHEEGNWEEGDFVLHLPGIGMDKRYEILKNTKVVL